MAAEDEMDLGKSKSITPLGSSMKSHGRAINKNAFRRFQKFFVRKRFKMPIRSTQHHRTSGIGLLRAAVLGANDGILSTSSLVLGVAAAHGTHRSILIAGIAGLVSGGMSMATSEYVSVHSQADTEEAELALERTKLKTDSIGERHALTAIYMARGLDSILANQVAQQLIAYDELGAYARDELGISEKFRTRPIQASMAAACSFAIGAMMPLLVTAIAPEARLIPFVSLSSLAVLALMGGLAAYAGGAKVIMGAIRVTFWGGLAMAMTSGIGWLVGAVA
jgi:VIT1/CCC1 family predicted Fe2+/Mn2+ transporter